jgi:formate dehydrogenase alpha subunit
LLRKQGQLAAVSWAEATDYVAREMTRLRGKLAGLSSSRCTNEENYLFQKWFRAGLGTHNVDCCARVCHAPSAAGMRWSFGAGAATNCLADIDLADLLMVAGSNTTESHPVTGARIKQRALEGVPLIVVDPRRTELAKLANVHLQLRPGTNVPLLNSLLHVIVREGYVDREFVDARTEGFAELAAHLESFAPETTAATTGVAPELVHRAAHLLGRARSPLQVHGLGMTEHHQGSETVMLLCNLAMLLGAVGRPGVGVNPLRGQNNVQGSADMGCQPDLLTGYCDPRDEAVRERFESIWQRPMPSAPGLTIPRMYEGVRDGSIRGMYIFGEDVAQTDPDANRVVEALSRLELLVVQELFLSETAKLAHVVLPGASSFEKDGTFTNGERRIQRVRRALPPADGSRPDWELLCELMGKTGYPQRYESPKDIMEEIARVAPATFGGVSYARLEGDGLCWPVPDANHPGTTRLHQESFARGRGRFACVEWIPSPSLGSDAPIRLVTGRVLEHYNAGSMTRRTANIHLEGSDFLTVHPLDAERRGIADGDRVRVTSDFGEALATADVCDDVAPGTAFLSFHFPETRTNHLTSDVVDRNSDCPEYKLTLVNVARA